MGDADRDIVAAVLGGEIDRFEELVVKYSPRVFRLVRRFARDEADAADLAQQAWIKAFQKLGSYRHTAPFEHWLMRITTRVCYDYLRNRQKSREHSFTELSGDSADWLASYVVEPDHSPERIEAARTLVHRLLEQLPPDARLVLTLLEIEGKSVKEISALTGWSVTLVKVRAFRARAKMRQLLRRLVIEKYL